MDQGVSDGTVTSGYLLGELLRRQLHNDFEELPIRPIAVIEQSFQILNGHD
jgi:hypothetical protein